MSEPSPAAPLPWRLPIFWGAATALWWALAAAPDVTWLDSPELAAGSVGLGIAHPPGHPLVMLLDKLVCLLMPLGAAAFRTNLASGLAMATSVAALSALAAVVAQPLWREWTGQEGMPRPVAVLAACLPPMLFAAAAWTENQAVRTEVYGLEAATSGWAAYLLARALLDPRHRLSHLVASGLLWGLSLSNHHVQALSALLPLGAALLVAAETRTSRRLAGFAAGLLLGMAPLAYLPIRAHAEPLVNWGHPDALARFWWLVSTHMYRHTPVQASTQAGLRLAWMARDLGLQAGPGALAAAVGLYALLRTRQLTRLGVLLTALTATSGAAALAAAYRPDNPDSGAYLLVALASLGLLAEAGLLAVSCVMSRARTPAAALLLVLATAPGAALAVSRFGRAHNWSASDTGFAVMATLPPGALFLAGYHETVFLAWYSKTAEGLRPDVCVLHRFGLFLPGRFPQMRRRCPELAHLVVSHEIPPDRLLASARPPILEPSSLPGDPLPKDATRLFVASGPLAHIRGHPAPGLLTWGDLQELLGDHRRRPGYRRFLLWHAYHTALLWAEHGRCDLARPAWNLAARLAPRDPAVRSLGRRCGLREPTR